MLATLDELENNLGCSNALMTIKSINQYQWDLDVPQASSEASGAEKDSRYYTIPAEPFDAHGRGESGVPLRSYQGSIWSRASKTPERPAMSDVIFGCRSNSMSHAASPGAQRT